MKIQTVKFAGKMSFGFKETLYNVRKDGNKAIIEYAEVEYLTNDYGKQNDVVMTAENGFKPELTGSGRLTSVSFDESAKKILDDAEIITGETFKIKDWIKSQYNVSFDWNTKSWTK